MEDSNGLKTQTLLYYILPQEKKCAEVFLKDRTSHLSYCCKSNQEGFFFFFFFYFFKPQFPFEAVLYLRISIQSRSCA